MVPHKAAYIPSKKARLEIGTAEYTHPGENEIVVKTAAVAVKLLDWVKQDVGDVFSSWIKYPFVMESDLAGEVVEVGPGVTRFKVEHGVQKETLLVWGGSTSVGCNAIQLATAAGYDVITTASSHIHGYLKKLGAIAKSLGFCIDVLSKCRGRKFIAQVSFDWRPSGFPQGPLDWPFAMRMGAYMVFLKSKAALKRLQVKFFWGTDNMANELGKAIYEDFLSQALRDGLFIAAPEPLVVGKGLEHIQEAMNLNKKGVSAKKVVVPI
ncbi:Alcohol dehydrogenase superfamily, zinc-type [Penicillium occitanis (nom. inval.)]|nr:Alcohol dehydrogenase superfamily, zinc-type [Penicillium occitanis (nom. inval.)]PCG94613.1 hypothetical protein PENOC_081800 [Penicillium occitanis (nom. inval.)]